MLPTAAAAERCSCSGAHSPPNLNVDPYSTGSSKKWSRVAIWSQCKCEKTTRHCSRPAASP
ncbi:Uncharacterised protein [Mycobacteroides abscessus subsp. abscessus]|nr:Uncharacterised protein [Mycobacteroides abscessus subsp. abscessus]